MMPSDLGVAQAAEEALGLVCAAVIITVGNRGIDAARAAGFGAMHVVRRILSGSESASHQSRSHIWLHCARRANPFLTRKHSYRSSTANRDFDCILSYPKCRRQAALRFCDGKRFRRASNGICGACWSRWPVVFNFG